MVKEHGKIAGVSLCAALFAVACSSDTAVRIDETFEPQDGQIAFRGTTSKAALSQAELKTYASDRQYVRNLAPRGKAITLNYADPRQYRFAITRLRLNGKTPENSPQLFKQIDDLKVAHQAKGLAAGAVAPLATLDGDLQSQHETMTAGITTATQSVLSGALVSRKEALAYGIVDSCTWDDTGEMLGDCSFVEVYGDMRYYTTQSTGNLALVQGQSVEGDSFMSVTIAGTEIVQQSYIVSPPKALTAADLLNLPTVEHPRDINADGVIKITLERNQADTDYHNMGMWTLKIPLKGSLSVKAAGVVLDAAALQTYKTNPPPESKIYVTLGNNGGGCTLPATGQGMSMKDFWSQVTVSPANNPTTLSWDLYNTPWANFSSSCQLIQATVYLTMDLVVPYVNNVTGTKGTVPVTITNAASQRPLTAPNLQFNPALRITNSCLAAGTMIEVADGEARKIENLHVGDRIFSPYASSLTITDTTIGSERAQMVRIKDALGHELLMTEMHPLYVVDRGMVAAKLLKVGDRVKTKDGTSQLVQVSRESYPGQVYNLKVGTAEEARSLGADQTAVYANGFLVGDSQIQSNYELVELQAADAAPKRVSTRWRTDYLKSLSRTGGSQN